MYGVRKPTRKKTRSADISEEQLFMSCPKCGAASGLHRYAVMAQNGSHADGLSCFMRGYWLEADTDESLQAAFLSENLDQAT